VLHFVADRVLTPFAVFVCGMVILLLAACDYKTATEYTCTKEQWAFVQEQTEYCIKKTGDLNGTACFTDAIKRQCSLKTPATRGS
jgi:hypothetical protein